VEARGPKSEVQTKLDKSARRIGSGQRKVRDPFYGFRKVESKQVMTKGRFLGKMICAR